VDLDQAAAEGLLRTTKSKYERYGILQALAETGILPNELITPRWDRFISPAEFWQAGENLKGSPRPDVVLPLAAWRGKLGLDLAARRRDLLDRVRRCPLRTCRLPLESLVGCLVTLVVLVPREVLTGLGWVNVAAQLAAEDVQLAAKRPHYGVGAGYTRQAKHLYACCPERLSK
jgi:hypothetical protein